MLSAQKNSHSVLTRAEALALVDDAATGADSLGALVNLRHHWDPGSPAPQNATAEDLVDWLVDFVELSCLTDEVRSDGPKDSDDTGLTAPDFY